MTPMLLGAILISFSSIMVVLADVPPDVAGFYRLFGGGLGLAFIVWRSDERFKLSPQAWKWACICSVFFAGDFFFWHRSIVLVGPGLSTMLVNFQAIILAVVSVVFLREKISLPFAVAIPMALLGLYLMVGVSWSSFTADFRLGIIYGLLTALAYSLYLMSLKYGLTRAGAQPLPMACVVALITGVLLGALSFWGGESFAIPSLKSFAALATLALLCHATGWFLLTKGISTIRTALVGLLLLLQPTLSFIWDVLFFHKATNAVELTGVCLALGAIYLGTVKRT